MTKAKKLTKTEQWIKGQNRRGSKLRDLLPTLSQYRRMSATMRRKYTNIMQNWKSNSPSRKGKALDQMQKYFYSIPGRTNIQQVLGGRMISNLESLYQNEQEKYAYEIEEAPGNIYRQGKPGAGFGFMRLDNLQHDKKGHVVGAKTAKLVGKLVMFRKMKRSELTVDNYELRDYLEGVEFYDNGDEQVAVARYGNGKGRFIDVYNKSTESTETIEQDLTRKGYPREKIDWDNPKLRRRDDITGWG